MLSLISIPLSCTEDAPLADGPPPAESLIAHLTSAGPRKGRSCLLGPRAVAARFPRDCQANALMTDRKPEGDRFLKWTIHAMPVGTFAIRSESSGCYLDGRGGEAEALRRAAAQHGRRWTTV